MDIGLQSGTSLTAPSYIQRYSASIKINDFWHILNPTRCKAKLDVNPPSYATSRLRPTTLMHYFSHMLPPSGECLRNSIVWISPTKIGYRGNVPQAMEKLISD